MDSVARRTTFKEAFCEYYHCPPEAFLRKALLRSFYPHAIPFALVFHAVQSTSLNQALDALTQAGEAEDITEISRAIGDYRYRLKMSKKTSFWVTSLRIRLSGKRLLNLFAKVQRQQNAPLPMPLTSHCG